jgi:hypothetical protein
VGVHSVALVKLVELECVPARQGAGRIEPSTQNEPDAQLSHAVFPAESWYLPGSQRVHASKPDPGATVPGAHSVGAMLLVGLKKPGAVGVHSAALVRVVELECVPP